MGGMLLGMGGLLIAIFGLTFGRANCTSPCGCCAGPFNSKPEARWYTRDIVERSSFGKANCSMVGCGTTVRVMYPDLLAAGLFFISVGVGLWVRKGSTTGSI